VLRSGPSITCSCSLGVLALELDAALACWEVKKIPTAVSTESSASLSS